MQTCTRCGKSKSKSLFPQVHITDFFPDGRLPICADCLDQMYMGDGSSWNAMDKICQWADIPFIPEHFTKIAVSDPEHAASQYIKLVGTADYQKLDWQTYEQRWKNAIETNQENLIHPAFNAAQIDRMRQTWGSSYSSEELIQLEQLYNSMLHSFGISDPARIDNARKMCKISLQIDRCIADGADGLDKLVSAYQKIQTIGGFMSEDAQDFNNFSSISELTLYMEKLGWKKKFHNDETKDMVDQTIHNIQSYNRRLYTNESTITDQIDEKIAAKRRMDRLEDDIVNDELDAFEVNATKELDEGEEFNPNM